MQNPAFFHFVTVNVYQVLSTTPPEDSHQTKTTALGRLTDTLGTGLPIILGIYIVTAQSNFNWS